MAQQSKFSALLATGRISNLPTVWSNVLVAFSLLPITGNYSLGNYTNLQLYFTSLLVVLIASSSLYVGGCFLGDAIDSEFDKKNKPSRPIPNGILKRSTIFSLASFLLSLGCTLPSAYLCFRGQLYDPPLITTTLLLTITIISYSLWHKRSPWFGLPLIGACRLLLIFFGVAFCHATQSNSLLIETKTYQLTLSHHTVQLNDNELIILIYAISVALYTISFASVARTESSNSPVTWRKGLILLMVLLPTFTLFSFDNFKDLSQLGNISVLACSLTAWLCYLVWIILATKKINTNKGTFVSMSLAGFCLLDTTILSLFGWQWLTLGLALFALSLLLQKWAPAT